MLWTKVVLSVAKRIIGRVNASRTTEDCHKEGGAEAHQEEWHPLLLTTTTTTGPTTGIGRRKWKTIKKSCERR